MWMGCLGSTIPTADSSALVSPPVTNITLSALDVDPTEPMLENILAEQRADDEQRP